MDNLKKGEGDVYLDNKVNRRLGRVGLPKKLVGAENKQERENIKSEMSKNKKDILGLNAGESFQVKAKDGKSYIFKRSEDGKQLILYVTNPQTGKEKKVREVKFAESK